MEDTGNKRADPLPRRSSLHGMAALGRGTPLCWPVSGLVDLKPSPSQRSSDLQWHSMTSEAGTLLQDPDFVHVPLRGQLSSAAPRLERTAC